MKKIVLILTMLPVFAKAQDTIPTMALAPLLTVAEEVTPEEEEEFAANPNKRKFQGRIDTTFIEDPYTGVKVVKELMLLPADWEYNKAVAAYERGDFYSAHQYAFQKIRNPAGLSTKRLKELYELAIRSSYANEEFSSAIVYYQEMKAKNLKPDEEMTKRAIFSYFPVKQLNRQNYYNIDVKDTAFVLKITNEMVAQDPKWLMMRSKIYGSMCDLDCLDQEKQAAYKRRMEEDLAEYSIQFEADDWKQVFPGN